MNLSTVKTLIKRFIPGDTKRTPLSCDAMNEIVDACNLIKSIEGRNGIKVIYSDSRLVISLASGSITTSNNNPNPPEPSTYVLPWKSQWKDNVDYFKGDIVRRNLPNEYNDGTVVGTYIAKQDAPIGSPPPTKDENAYWEVFAPFACNHLVMVGSGETLTLDCRDGLPLLQLGATSSPHAYIYIYQGDNKDKIVRLNPEDICDASTNPPTTRQKLFLESIDSF